MKMPSQSICCCYNRPSEIQQRPGKVGFYPSTPRLCERNYKLFNLLNIFTKNQVKSVHASNLHTLDLTYMCS